MRYLYVWVSMIGMALALRRNQFTVIEAVSNMIREKAPCLSKILNFSVMCSQIIFFCLLTFYGSRLVFKNLNFVSPALGVPMGLAYVALPLGGVLGLLYCGIAIWDHNKEA